MIVKRVFLILLGILLLLGPVTAYYASSTSFLPSDPAKIWIIADTGQQNVIKLVATNATYGPVKNAPVTFTVDNPLLGTVTPISTSTDNNGEALCTFTVSSTDPTSGTARITADVVSSDGATNYHTIVTWNQKIDHNVPYKASFVVPAEGTVESAGTRSVIPFKVSITDRWDNIVDDRYEIEKSLPSHALTLHVNGPSPNNCSFTDFGLDRDHTFNLDTNGQVITSITPATKPGWHYVRMEPMGSIPEQMKMFNTIADGIPFSMTQEWIPDGTGGFPPTVTTNGGTFSYYYRLLDKYGNPTRNQYIWINTSVPGEEQLRFSLENGEVWSTYGPKPYTSLFTIEATPVANPSLQLSKIVRFYSNDPQGLDLTVNPHSMPSRDANPNIYANITAKVTDIMGNGVGGQSVTFRISDVTNSAAEVSLTAAQITAMGANYKEPSFSPTSTVTSIIGPDNTDADGYTTVRFYPGSYATTSQPGSIQAVTGTARLTAEWGGKQKDEPVLWKNYPYLSASVDVNPKQAKVGEAVDVSLKLIGDGWALSPNPIDVDLVLDRSGSMATVLGVAPATRLSVAKAAANNFIGNMNSGQDKVGLFSYSGKGDVTNVFSKGAALQRPFGPVTTAVTSLSSGGSTSTREAVKKAIDDMVLNGNPDPKAVHALIVMTDGDWNNEGSPAAKGTGWPEGNPDYCFSGGSVELNNYRYYPTLNGTLTSYTSTTCTSCDAGHEQNRCQVCAPGYTRQTGEMGPCYTGRCCVTGASPAHCHYPTEQPAWCSQRECTVGFGTGCDTLYKLTGSELTTTQNLSVYAKDNNIRLYFIFFAGTPGVDTSKTLSTMANATGGFYQAATTAAELNTAYTKIAGALQSEAGVGTRASLDFGTLIINDAQVTCTDLLPCFDYVADPIAASPVKGVDSPTLPPGSTMLDKYNKTPWGILDQHQVPGFNDLGFAFPDTGPMHINQTTQWNAPATKRNLSFNIGTVKLNETWETSFRLRVLTEGNILIFGPQSQVCFDGADGHSCMRLPNLSLSVNSSAVNTGQSLKTITVTGLSRTDSGPVKSTLPIAWTTTYDGTQLITEDVSYISNDGTPVKFETKTFYWSHGLPPRSSILNTQNLPPGGYIIQVHAYTDDASDTESCGSIPSTPCFTITDVGKFIKLE